MAQGQAWSKPTRRARKPADMTSPKVSDVTITHADGTVEIQPAMTKREADAFVRRVRRRKHR